MGPLYKFIASVSSFALFSGGFFAAKSAQAVEVDTESVVSSSSNAEQRLQDEQLSRLLDDVIEAHAEVRVTKEIQAEVRVAQADSAAGAPTGESVAQPIIDGLGEGLPDGAIVTPGTDPDNGADAS
jgi:hypothetical protein